MHKLLTPQVLLILFIIALLILGVGIYLEIEATRRYNELDGIDIQPLIADAPHNQTSADALATITINKTAANQASNQALTVIGFGVALFGLVVFAYLRLPDKPTTSAQS